MPIQKTFALAKIYFDDVHSNAKTTKCLVPVNGQSNGAVGIIIPLQKSDKSPLYD